MLSGLQLCYVEHIGAVLEQVLSLQRSAAPVFRARHRSGRGREMVQTPDERWKPVDRDKVYAELDHAADVFVEVWGDDLPKLFENALFALYDQLAELEGFTAEYERRSRCAPRRMPSYARCYPKRSTGSRLRGSSQ